MTVTTGTKVLVNNFTIGKEAELETVTGEKVKVSWDTNLSDANNLLNVVTFSNGKN